MQQLIKTLSLNDFYINPAAFINDIKTACETTGFFFLSDHGMDQMVIEKGEESFRKFLTEVELEKRMAYSYPEKGYQIGYTPPRIETGEFAKTPDEKHFFHVYPKDMPFIKEVPIFRDSTNMLWYQFHKLAGILMRAIALSIGEFSDFFKAEKDKGGYSLLRGIHYPAGQKPVDDDEAVTEGGNAVGMCASKHTDINIMHEGKWTPITIEDRNLLIVNVGDMLQNLTNGRYKSGLHRVVCQENKERFSIPFFYHVPDDFSIFPLVQFGEPKEQFRFETAGEFLNYRLKQIGLLT